MRQRTAVTWLDGTNPRIPRSTLHRWTKAYVASPASPSSRRTAQGLDQQRVGIRASAHALRGGAVFCIINRRNLTTAVPRLSDVDPEPAETKAVPLRRLPMSAPLTPFIPTDR